VEQYPFTPNGIAPDLVPEAAPANYWTGATNMYSRDGMERAGGTSAAFGTPLFPPKWLLNTKSTAAPSFWIYGADAGIGGTDGAGNHFDLTPAGFVANAEANCWTGGNLNGVPVVCNGGVPYWWDGNTANNFVALPGWPTNYKAKAIRPYQFHLVALNIDPALGKFNGDLLLWSTAAAPGAVPSAWTPAPANEAGSAQVSATSGELIDAAPMRGTLVIYKNTSCYTLQYVGGAAVMTLAPLFSDVGIIARNCVAEIDGLHVCLADGDIVQHDGQSVVSLADSTVRETYLRLVDKVSIRSSFVVAWTPPGEVWVCVPQQGFVQPSVALVWDMIRKRWGVRDLAEIAPSHIAQGVVALDLGGGLTWATSTTTWATDARLWSYTGPNSSAFSLLAAGAEEDLATTWALVPGLFALDQTFDTLGEVIMAQVFRRALDFGRPDTLKMVNRVWVKAKGPRGTRLGVRLAGTLNAGEEPVYGAAAYITIGGRMDAPLFAQGRYISVSLTDASDRLLDQWKVSEVLFDYATRGQF
jgi:hypothetical protein